MSDTLGKTLAAARAKKGLSVEEVSAVTRINAKFIRMIEEDKFDQLPGEVFIRGLLRSYAGVVGLSGDEMVARYNTLGVSIKDRSPELISVPLRPESRWLKKMTISVLFVTALVGIVYYYLGPQEPYSEKPFAPAIERKSMIKKRGGFPGEAPFGNSPAQDAASIKTEEIQTEPEQEAKPELKEKSVPAQPVPSPDQPQSRPVTQEPSKPESRAVEPVRQPADVSAPEKGKRKLTVTASDVSWVSVTIDGTTTRQVFLNAGETVVWMGEKGFKITIGNAAATKVYLDGVEIKLKNAVQNVIKEMEIPLNKVTKPEGLEG